MRLKIAIILILVITLCILYFPIEYAINPNKLPSGKYLLVKTHLVTDVEWVVIGDESGFKNSKYINLTGITPHYRYSTDIVWGINSNNTFICYDPEYIGKSAIMYTPLDTYKIGETKILSPINRGADFPIIFMPKNYICVLDIIFGKVSYLDSEFSFFQDVNGNIIRDIRPSIK